MPGPSDTVSCPHALACPGCPLIGLSYGEQLAKKREQVLHAMARYPETGASGVMETVSADPIAEYRQRAKLVVHGTSVGLFARGSHDVVDLPGCRVMDPVLLRVADAVRTALPLDVGVRALDLRRTDEGVLAVLVVPTGAKETAVRAAAERVLRAAPDVIGVAVSHRDDRSPQLLGSVPVAVAGQARARSRVREDGPWHYAVHGAFVQAHHGQERALTEAIVRAIEASGRPMQGARVLELFSGSGALALDLAARGARVRTVEVFEPAARLAREAADAQGLPVHVETGEARERVRALAEKAERFDVVIANPPRRGLPPDLRADLARLSPALFVYVSCEPPTLARDLADFARKGLGLAMLVPHDMMPLTEEVETLAVLSPAHVPDPEVLYRDEALLAVAKAAHEPMTPQGEHARSLLDRVRRLEGAEHATPVHRLDVGTSGVALFALRPEHVPVLSRALGEGEKEYVALARGVVRDKGSIRRPLIERGRPHEARTRYARRAIVGGHSLLAVRPDQGRKHQIRRHLAAIGHAVVGDERYGHGPTNDHFAARHYLDRPFLHCARISIDRAGTALEIRAPLAADLAGVLERLEGQGTG